MPQLRKGGEELAQAFADHNSKGLNTRYMTHIPFLEEKISFYSRIMAVLREMTHIPFLDFLPRVSSQPETNPRKTRYNMGDDLACPISLKSP